MLGYGAGSLIFSPLTEIPAIGRNPPYAISGTLFIALCFPSATVDDYASHMVLRFLLGFLASPCLATVVASYADIWGDSVAIAVAIFAAVASLSPALGPVVASYAVQSMGWQFWAWELLAIAGPAWLLMICMVPETSAPTILYYRTKQIRRETGDTRIVSDAETKQSKTKLGSTLWFALVKPWQINIKARFTYHLHMEKCLRTTGPSDAVCNNLHWSLLRPGLFIFRGAHLCIPPTYILTQTRLSHWCTQSSTISHPHQLHSSSSPQLHPFQSRSPSRQCIS